MPRHLTCKKRWVIVAVILMGFSMALGVPCAHGSFTIQDEERLGREFYEQLNSKNMLIHNPRISDYIDTIGRRILHHSEESPFSFTFSVVDNPGINAFATPGGYIYVYTGLIKLADNEAQLAGVIAHEIAHATSRHIAETIEKSKKMDIAALLGVLAGAFLGGGGEGAAAITSFSMAAATTLNLKYTRDNEEEADRKGMRFLTASGYDGSAMLDFLKTMRRFEYLSNSIPSYFLTHPGTSDRIRYLDGLLHTTYTQRGDTGFIGGLNGIKTALVLEGDNLTESLKFFHNALAQHPDDPDFTYGLAVVQGKRGEISEALKNFSKALSLSPDDPRILRDLGVFYFNQGKTLDALEPLKKSYYFNHNDGTTVLYLGRAYEATGNYFDALELYRKFQRDNPDDLTIHYSLAMVYGKTDNTGESHYHFGIYFKKMNKRKSALFHFKAAQKYFPADSEKGRFIQNEINELEKPPSPGRHSSPPPGSDKTNLTLHGAAHINE